MKIQILRRIIFFALILVLSNQSYTQSINLSVVGENQDATKIIDSINYKKNHTNYNGLQNEINRLKIKLTKDGYIDTSIKNIHKQNDSLFEAQFILGKRINKIRIYYDSRFNTEYLTTTKHLKDTNFFEILMSCNVENGSPCSAILEFKSFN